MKDACHNCGQEDLEVLYSAPAFDSELDQEKYSLGLARCRLCKLVNTTGASSEEVAAAYSNEYYGSASSKFISIIERAVSLASTFRARKITRIWRRGRAKEDYPSVLDIGCGRAHLLRAFQAMGATVQGLERQEFPADEGNHDIVSVGSIGDPEFATRQFDIIILWHVLEHLEKHEELLDTITEHLKHNGLLVIAVPDFASLQQRIFSKYWFHLDLPRHLVHFESAWLMQQLSRRGYTITRTSYMDPLQNTFGFIQSAMNRIAPRQLNDYYRSLKYVNQLKREAVLPLIKWSLISVILLPFAILDNILGALTSRGATVQVFATLEKGE